MTSPIQPDKTYGVLHTESFFSFLGFAKKIGSSETQKVDIYLDNKLIDTIEANKFIEKIDDMYDVENQAFSYNLPTEYIGKKATISFKNHDSGEELLNSPYTLIDKNHESFNEARFIHSLNEPISEELRNMYKPNSIGFLATKENLEDDEFVQYIKKIQKRFPRVEFKTFYFNNHQKKLAEEVFNDINNIQFIIPKNIYQINENCLIWLSRNDSISLLIRKYVRYALFINFEAKNLSIKDYENKYKDSFKVFYSNPSKFGEKDNSSFFGIAYNNLIKSLDSNLFIDINANYFEFSAFKQIDLAIRYDKFIEKAKKLSSLLKE
ncbi:hypothetical protein [Aliarcobacter butzleri]|uniref:hypothetical protein n=1 Tax=Aliarcobacter butzleri TaxID=28197 RepID=UPI0012FBD3DF|nr:hypothetical protein [Aliarcobacter butzleri]